MGFDDVCNTGLGLGIYKLPPQNGHVNDRQMKEKEKRILKYDNLLPSLTLGPSEEEDDVQHQVQASSLSTAHALSSFSNSGSVKKEREAGGGGDEEVELERVSNSRASDEDEEEGSPRKKLRLNKAQFATLEETFKDHSTLTPKQKKALAEKLNLRPRQVEVWFQNRRARTKLKQTESDCELLKKCCEKLTEENKKLQKELQQLKSLKAPAPSPAAPLHMEMPAAAALTLCPSCERICSGGGGGGGSSTGGGPLFFKPFTHPSTASC